MITFNMAPTGNQLRFCRFCSGLGGLGFRRARWADVGLLRDLEAMQPRPHPLLVNLETDLL